MKLPAVPAPEPDITTTPFKFVPVPFLEAETLVTPAIVAELIALTKFKAADAVACVLFECPVPNATNLCVAEFYNPAEDETNTNETSPNLNSSGSPV